MIKSSPYWGWQKSRWSGLIELHLLNAFENCNRYLLGFFLLRPIITVNAIRVHTPKCHWNAFHTTQGYCKWHLTCVEANMIAYAFPRCDSWKMKVDWFSAMMKGMRSEGISPTISFSYSPEAYLWRFTIKLGHDTFESERILAKVIEHAKDRELSFLSTLLWSMLF